MRKSELNRTTVGRGWNEKWNGEEFPAVEIYEVCSVSDVEKEKVFDVEMKKVFGNYEEAEIFAKSYKPSTGFAVCLNVLGLELKELENIKDNENIDIEKLAGDNFNVPFEIKSKHYFGVKPSMIISGSIELTMEQKKSLFAGKSVKIGTAQYKEKDCTVFAKVEKYKIKVTYVENKAKQSIFKEIHPKRNKGLKL